MNFFERRKILKNTSAFDLTPIHLVKHELNENKLVTVLIPKFQNKLAVKLFEPKLKSPNIKLKLDELGSAVWLAVDGKKKVGVIARELVDAFGDKIQPVEERLPKFFTQLYEQKLITFDELKGA
ncbi:MAG: PqqD family protein [Ignavibacteriales bacterium]|nr:PqqD family protein [Ignavibacteriales bacterium]